MTNPGVKVVTHPFRLHRSTAQQLLTRHTYYLPTCLQEALEQQERLGADHINTVRALSGIAALLHAAAMGGARARALARATVTRASRGLIPSQKPNRKC